MVSNTTTQLQNPVFLSTIGNTLLAANYHGGDNTSVQVGAGVTSFAIEEGCRLKFGMALPSTGHSVDPTRQMTSHMHSVTPDAKFPGRFYGCDLGADLVITYHVDADTRAIAEVARHHAKPGSGPRHTAVHPTLDTIYVLHEMGSYVAVLDVAADGALTEVQKMSSLPAGYQGMSKAAEVVVTEDGRFVLATNRGFGEGSNSIAVYKVAASGQLSLVEVAGSGGMFPRGMELLPDSQYTVMVEGQSSGNLAVMSM